MWSVETIEYTIEGNLERHDTGRVVLQFFLHRFHSCSQMPGLFVIVIHDFDFNILDLFSRAKHCDKTNWRWFSVFFSIFRKHKLL